MPIDAVCPKCQGTYRLADTLMGKQVRCKQCQNPFIVGAAPAKKGPPPPPVPAGPPASGVRAKTPPAPPKGAVSNRPMPVLTVDDGDDDDDDRPRRGRAPQAKSGGSALMLILIVAIGGVLLLGGGATALILWMNSGPATTAEEKDKKDGGGDKGGGGDKAAPVEAGKAAEAIQKMHDLSQNNLGRGLALRWLADNPMPNHPKRGEIAAAIATQFDQHGNHMHGFFQIEDASRALAVWGTKDQVGMLMVHGQNPQNFANPKRHHALHLLGLLKHEPAIPLLLDRLNDHWDRPWAAKGLQALGTTVKDEVAKRYFHKDHGIRNEIRRIAAECGVTDDDIMTVVIQDLKSTDGQTRYNACEYLAGANVNEKRRAEVAKELEPILTSTDISSRNKAFNAIARWGNAQNAKALVKLYFSNDGWVREQSRQIATKLGASDDDIINAALEKMQSNEPNDRNTATQFLADIKDVNEKRRADVSKALEPLLDIKEANVRGGALRALEKWGTVENLPAILKQYEEKRTFDYNDLNKVLAAIPDDRSVEQLFKQVGHFFDRSGGIPQTGIRKHGPEKGTKHAVANMNHENGDIRGFARQLIVEWKVNPDDLVKQSLQDVNSAEQNRRSSAVEWLSKNGPYAGWAPQVVQAVGPLMSSPDFGIKNNAKVAVKLWSSGTPVVVNPPDKMPPDKMPPDKMPPDKMPPDKMPPDKLPAEAVELLKKKDSPDAVVRHQALLELGKMKDDKYIDAIAPHLRVATDRKVAGDSLIQIGSPKVEQLAAQLLFFQDRQVAVEAARVLEFVGTSNSLPALQQAMKQFDSKGPNFTFQNNAKKAVKAIQAKGK